MTSLSIGKLRILNLVRYEVLELRDLCEMCQKEGIIEGTGFDTISGKTVNICKECYLVEAI